MSADLPAPPVPADADCQRLDYMPLKIKRLTGSDTWAVATGDEAKAAVSLWCYAWHEIPAGSIPNDERVLAIRSGAGAKWKKVRDVALRGFVLCSDGRLYHRTICEEVMVAMEARVKWRARKARQRGGRDRDIPEGHDDVPRDNPVTDEGHDRDERVPSRECPPLTFVTGHSLNSSVPIGTGAEAPPSVSPDPATVVFRQGLDWLRRQTGKAEPACRAMLGKWRKAHGDEALIAVLGKAQREGPIDAIAWIEGAFRQRPVPAAGAFKPRFPGDMPLP